MIKKLLFFLLLSCSYHIYGQLTCPTINTPLDGDTNVSVGTNISWNEIVGAPGYLISMGTTPGGTDIVNEQNVGNATSYQPPLGLPENTDIYVTITIFFFNAENILCTTEMFRTANVTEPPSCTSPAFPIDGSTNVNVTSAIRWNHALTATGYSLSLGTTPGGNDILNNENIVGSLFFQPTTDLPVDTEIFVRLIPYNNNGSAQPVCSIYSFTTGALAIIPNCSSLISPLNGAINVNLSPIIEWTMVPNATGYRLTIGTTPFNANVLDNVTLLKNSTPVVNFQPNLTFFITITPFNEAGDAIGCTQESFSTILGCGPFFNADTGEFEDLRPEINFPNTISFCKNEIPLNVKTTDTAEGFRWYKLDQNNNETLLSSTNELVLTEEGRYRYEAFNTASQSGSIIECANSKIFNVVSSETATNVSFIVTGQNGNLDITVQNSGSGDYEYAVDDIDGPYQNSSDFKNVELGPHTFYLQDKNGCGIVEINFEQDLTLEGFPKFFTPNGDGVNDYWQIIPPVDGGEMQTGIIEIFDRYGALLAQVSPTSQGWDGNFNGKPLPISDYWFKTVSVKNKKIEGHFTLKR